MTIFIFKKTIKNCKFCYSNGGSWRLPNKAIKNVTLDIHSSMFIKKFSGSFYIVDKNCPESEYIEFDKIIPVNEITIECYLNIKEKYTEHYYKIVY